MATFASVSSLLGSIAKTSFSASSYASFRPTYPSHLYTHLLSHHRGGHALLLDLGTGPGLVARALSPHFTKVIGVDPSAGMLAQARALSPAPEFAKVSYVQSQAEQLGFVDDRSVDMVVAAQAAHWFDQSKLWPELARVVRRGGTVAFWGYNDHVLIEWPKASKIVDYYAYDQSDQCMGRYWPQPGRSIVRGNLRAIVPPDKQWENVNRWEYEPRRSEEGQAKGMRLMEAETTIRDMGNACRTWSAYHEWMEAHDVKPRNEGGKGDVVDVMLEKMAEAEEWKGNWMDKVVKLEWGSGVLMAEKR